MYENIFHGICVYMLVLVLQYCSLLNSDFYKRLRCNYSFSFFLLDWCYIFTAIFFLVWVSAQLTDHDTIRKWHYFQKNEFDYPVYVHSCRFIFLYHSFVSDIYVSSCRLVLLCFWFLLPKHRLSKKCPWEHWCGKNWFLRPRKDVKIVILEYEFI